MRKTKIVRRFPVLRRRLRVVYNTTEYRPRTAEIMSSSTGQKTPPLIRLDEVRKIADLARLEFSEEALEAMAQSMSDILTLMRALDEADVQGVEPLLNPLDQVQRLRADAVGEEPQKESLQAIAPDADGDYYRVPRVIDG